jgi:hypothetical protein
MFNQPGQAVRDLRDEVIAHGLPAGVQRSLRAKLEEAGDALAAAADLAEFAGDIAGLLENRLP